MLINWTLLRPRNVVVILAIVIIARFILAQAMNAIDGQQLAAA